MAPKLHIICDSHGSIYSGFGPPFPVFHSAYHDGVPYCMNRLGKDQDDPICFAHERKGVCEDDVVMYVLGEPDVRIHIWRQINLKGREEAEVIRTLASNFIEAITSEARKMGSRTIVRFVVPPRKNSYFRSIGAMYSHMLVDGAFVPSGTLEDRARYTRSLNASLAAACAENGIIFLPSLDFLADSETGELKDEFMTEQTHLNKHCVPALFEQLHKALADMGVHATPHE